MAATVQETEARFEKAATFAAHLFAAGVSSVLVPMIDQAQWQKLALPLGINPPNPKNPEPTVATICAILRKFEAARARMERESGTQAVDLSNL